MRLRLLIPVLAVLSSLLAANAAWAIDDDPDTPDYPAPQTKPAPPLPTPTHLVTIFWTNLKVNEDGDGPLSGCGEFEDVKVVAVSNTGGIFTGGSVVLDLPVVADAWVTFNGPFPTGTAVTDPLCAGSSYSLKPAQHMVQMKAAINTNSVHLVASTVERDRQYFFLTRAEGDKWATPPAPGATKKVSLGIYTSWGNDDIAMVVEGLMITSLKPVS